MFKYLGRKLSNNGNNEEEVKWRISAARDEWRRIKSFELRCLRRILGVRGTMTAMGICYSKNEEIRMGQHCMMGILAASLEGPSRRGWKASRGLGGSTAGESTGRRVGRGGFVGAVPVAGVPRHERGKGTRGRGGGGESPRAPGSWPRHRCRSCGSLTSDTPAAPSAKGIASTSSTFTQPVRCGPRAAGPDGGGGYALGHGPETHDLLPPPRFFFEKNAFLGIRKLPLSYKLFRRESLFANFRFCISFFWKKMVRWRISLFFCSPFPLSYKLGSLYGGGGVYSSSRSLQN